MSSKKWKRQFYHQKEEHTEIVQLFSINREAQTDQNRKMTILYLESVARFPKVEPDKTNMKNLTNERPQHVNTNALVQGHCIGTSTS